LRDTTCEVTATLNDDRLLRPRETADKLGVSLRQLDRLVKTGVLAPVRLTAGGNRRYRATDVAALVAGDETKED
jgi:predicted site-specific integrase-resolvase